MSTTLSENNQESMVSVESGAQKISFEKVDKAEFEKIPDIALQRNEVIDDRKDELKYKTLDKDEVHILPTLHVQEKPIIIEKEIEYEKPVQVKQTIIHQEKPIIIEQPIIKEKHEHYRESTEYVKHDEKIVRETVHEQDVGNLDKEELAKLRTQRIEEYQDTTPIIHKEKEQIQLQADIREKPTIINEKEVVYKQPVEIQQTVVEKIKPTVREEVTLEKEHIYQKLVPEVHIDNTTQIFEGDTYYSKDVANNRVIATNDVNTNTNTNESSGIEQEQNQKREVM